MILAIDDTDGPGGGCTTHVAHTLIDQLPAGSLAGWPRLVRLFPANPWKTRGNAAVAIPLETTVDPHGILKTAFDHVANLARVADGKGAGVALLEDAPEEAWYQRGVQGPIGLEDARAALDELGAGTRTLGTGRGLIGCLCAAAWRPGPLSTYERITYRQAEAWGTPREIDPDSVQAVAGAYEETFDCYDPVSGHVAMAPRTPCPVLHGLRATRPDRLAEACAGITGEPGDGATTFVTNQATDDHVTDEALVALTCQEAPEALEGGHVRLACRTPDGQARTCMAFEPTGGLREAVLRIQPGDTVLPVGDLRDGPDGPQVNLEKLYHVPAERRATQACPACGTAMGSAGRDAGVRCRRCGHRAPDRHERPRPAWYEADVSARRHLSRPLALELAPRVSRALEGLAPGGQPADVGKISTS